MGQLNYNLNRLLRADGSPVITHINLDSEKNRFIIDFEDYILYIYDSEDLCCEYRYITCDDAFEDFIGAELIDIKEKPIEELESGYEDFAHEIVFIEIQTTSGSLTLCTHNEHNGYYSGFNLKYKLVKKPSQEKLEKEIATNGPIKL